MRNKGRSQKSSGKRICSKKKPYWKEDWKVDGIRLPSQTKPSLLLHL